MIRETIKQRMMYAGYTQAEVCKALGLTPQNFNAFLRGARGMGYDEVVKVAEYLGLYLNLDGLSLEIHDFPQIAKQAAKVKYGTVRELATRIGLNTCTVSSILSGQRHPSYATLEKMFVALGMELTPLVPVVIATEMGAAS